MTAIFPRYDEDKVREYLDQDEGDPPPIFVGHQTILRDVFDIAIRKAGRPKVTRILQGAPGAGKSSLLAEMQKKWTGEDGKPRVVTLLSTDLMDNPAIGVKAVLNAAAMEQTRWIDILKDRIRRLRGVGAGPGGVSMQFSGGTVPKTLYEITDRYPSMKGSGPIIVAVDETQRFEPDRNTPQARFLQSVHDSSSGLSLTLVLAGLSDTVDVARAMHLTRGRNVHEVKPLKEFQARYFMRELALHFGLDTSRHRQHIGTLANLCDGWPRHLRQAGVALAEETRRVNGDMDRMDWATLRSRTWTLRQAFYNDQFNTPLQQAHRLVAAVMSDIPEAKDRKTNRPNRARVLDIIDQHRDHDNSRSHSWRLPEGFTTERLLNILIHQGALYQDCDGLIHSPIPSFRSWLIDAGEEPEGSGSITDIQPDGGESDDIPSP